MKIFARAALAASLPCLTLGAPALAGVRYEVVTNSPGGVSQTSVGYVDGLKIRQGVNEPGGVGAGKANDFGEFIFNGESDPVTVTIVDHTSRRLFVDDGSGAVAGAGGLGGLGGVIGQAGVPGLPGAGEGAAPDPMAGLIAEVIKSKGSETPSDSEKAKAAIIGGLLSAALNKNKKGEGEAAAAAGAGGVDKGAIGAAIVDAMGNLSPEQKAAVKGALPAFTGGEIAVPGGGEVPGLGGIPGVGGEIPGLGGEIPGAESPREIRPAAGEYALVEPTNPITPALMAFEVLKDGQLEHVIWTADPGDVSGGADMVNAFRAMAGHFASRPQGKLGIGKTSLMFDVDAYGGRLPVAGQEVSADGAIVLESTLAGAEVISFGPETFEPPAYEVLAIPGLNP